MRLNITKLNRLSIPKFIIVGSAAREEYARFVKLVLFYNKGRKDLMDEKTVNSAWVEVVHTGLSFHKWDHWLKQSSPTHFRYAEIWRSVSLPAEVKAGLESEHEARRYVSFTLDPYRTANGQWKDDQAMIDASLTLRPLILILLRRGYTMIGRTRTYLAQLNREKRRNEDAEKLAFSAEDEDDEKLAFSAKDEVAEKLASRAEDKDAEKLASRAGDEDAEKLASRAEDKDAEKLASRAGDEDAEKLAFSAEDEVAEELAYRAEDEDAEKLAFSEDDEVAEKLASRAKDEDAVRLAFSAEVFLRYGSSLLKETRQALAMAKHLATKLEQEKMMRDAAALKARDESELRDIMDMWSLTQQTKGNEPETPHYDIPTTGFVPVPWPTGQIPSWKAPES